MYVLISTKISIRTKDGASIITSYSSLHKGNSTLSICRLAKYRPLPDRAPTYNSPQVAIYFSEYGESVLV